MSFSGGVVRFGQQAFFVPFACPGDVVRAEVTDEKKHKARLVDIIEASEDRVEPRCPLFGKCGGCTLQHIGYERQAAEKKKIVADSLGRIGGVEAMPDIGFVPSPPYGYRNRVELHTDGEGTGFKAAKSAKVVPARDCPAAVPVVRDFIKHADCPHGRRRFTVYGFDDRIAVEGGDTERLFVPGLEITMDVRLFFQSNLEAQKTLVADVAALAGKGGVLADIYCGVGAFARSLAAGFGALVLVEENPGAIALARENLRGIPSLPGDRADNRADYYALSAERYCAALQQNTKNAHNAGHWDVAVVDPPREGLCVPLIDLFIRLKTAVLIYVSCNPATLARDTQRLCAGGYRLESVTCYDFYPQTTHIECAALFRY
ncbi:MAG: class I SAM-dependent RNA methyltransferase [Spirochaetaceae bacterium]|nr:class I SAM-dependent RNA methyltransferase [Spirochaetaceae bacterium]